MNQYTVSETNILGKYKVYDRIRNRIVFTGTHAECVSYRLRLIATL